MLIFKIIKKSTSKFTPKIKYFDPCTLNPIIPFGNRGSICISATSMHQEARTVKHTTWIRNNARANQIKSPSAFIITEIVSGNHLSIREVLFSPREINPLWKI